MKKFLTVFAAVVLCIATVCTFAACDQGEVKTGEYHYNAWGVEYGVKVNVTVKKDNTISKVEFAESDYVKTSPDNAGYGWTGHDTTEAAYPNYLASFAGKKVADVLAIKVVVNASGVPQSVSDSASIISGATQSSGRIVLAIQNAIGEMNIAYQATAIGSYHYVAWNTEYGIKVKVTTEGKAATAAATDVITKVEFVESDYVRTSAGWTNHDTAEAGYADYLKKFEGKTRAEMAAITVSEAYEISDSNLVLTGATQSSARIVNAVKNALSGANDVVYSYGLVHGGSYVAEATLTIKPDKTIIAGTLDEACLPTYVSLSEAPTENADDYVADEVTSHGATSTKYFYKTVKIGSTTYTYSATAHDYVAGEVTLKSALSAEKGAREYFAAVKANTVKVTIGGEEKTDILCAASLLKSQNGYWTKTDDENGTFSGTAGASYSRWNWNAQKTIEYLKANGFKNAESLTKETEAGDDGLLTWVDSASVDSGATWSDMNSAATGYYNYISLFKLAYEKAF